MKRWLVCLLSVFSLSPALAFDLDQKMYLAEHYVSYTSSFDVSTDERKLGTLYRRVLSLNTKYDFYDIKNKLIATADSHFLSFGAHLDIYDENQTLLGTVEEKIFTWFPSFEIFSPGGVRLAKATMNFWGTTFTLQDPRSNRVLAEMSRDFLRLRNYWTIDIKDLDSVKERHIDARLLLTVLAVQGDIEYLEQYRRRQRERDRQNNNQPVKPSHRAARRLSVTPPPISNLHNKYADFLKKENELNEVVLPDEKQLNSLAKQLDHDFQQQYAGMEMSSEEQTAYFMDYCMTIADSATTSLNTQKGILHLLNKRISEQATK